MVVEVYGNKKPRIISKEKRAKRLFRVKKDPVFCELVGDLGDIGYGSVSVLGSCLWCRDVDILQILNQSLKIQKHIHKRLLYIHICMYICMMFLYIQKWDVELKMRS